MSYFPLCFRFIHLYINASGGTFAIWLKRWKCLRSIVQYDHDKCLCVTIVSAYLTKKYKKSLYVTILRVNRLANNPLNDFNIEFQMQLNLYYEMGYRLDGSKSKYRYYLMNNCLNSLLGSQIQEHRTVLSSYLKKISKVQKKKSLLRRHQYFVVLIVTNFYFPTLMWFETKTFIKCDLIFIEPANGWFKVWSMQQKIQKKLLFMNFDVIIAVFGCDSSKKFQSPTLHLFWRRRAYISFIKYI